MCEYLSLSDDIKSRCWFLTLTYDDNHNPIKLNYRDIQLFIKRLRKIYKDFKIKYFYCGEYGETTFRPHYHMIIYNLPIYDLKKQSVNRMGDILFKSDFLANVWKNGFVSIGRLSLRSASYVARYTLKSTGTDEGLRVSKGFGKEYFLDNMDEIIAKNYVKIANNVSKTFVTSSVPKYFLKLYRKYLFEKNGNDNEYFDYLIWRKNQRKDFLDTKISYYGNVKQWLSERDLIAWMECGATYGVSPEQAFLEHRSIESFKKRVDLLKIRNMV